MSSPSIDLSLSDKEITFDTYEIDYKIFKDGEFIQKIELESPFSKKIIDKFKLIQGLTQDEIQKKDEKSTYPKYFATVSTKSFDYIGILNNHLKRDIHGYSKMDNNDEFLGEYKNEIREGFGIYKFGPNGKEEEIKEIYIGDYKNNKKEGQGMYLKIYKSIKENPEGDVKLINFSSGIGIFEDDVLKSGKIFSSKEGIDMLYQGKLNEIGEPEDNDAIIFEEGNKIFRGKISKGDMVEGRNIFINEKYEKTKAYYFYKKEDKYEFDYATKEEIDEECIKKMKENPVDDYGMKITNIFKEMSNAFEKFKDYEAAIKIDFENEIKNKIKNEIDKLIKQ